MTEQVIYFFKIRFLGPNLGAQENEYTANSYSDGTRSYQYRNRQVFPLDVLCIPRCH